MSNEQNGGWPQQPQQGWPQQPTQPQPQQGWSQPTGPQASYPQGPPTFGAPAPGQPPYGAPGQPPYATTPPAARKSRKGLITAMVVAGVVTVGGVGAAAATKFLGSSGGQPDQVLPKNSIAFMRVDMDPSAGQKIAAYRLFDKLPKAKDALLKDPKQALFDQLKAADKDLADLDYAKDIEPWLGNRMGLALMAPYDGDTDPIPVMAVQVKDEKAAEAGYQKLADKAKNAAPSAAKKDSAHWFKDGYLIVTDAKQEKNVRSAIDAGNLASQDTYKSDVAALGDTGVASWWLDAGKVFDLIGKSKNLPTNIDMSASAQGRSFGTVRFSSDYVEMTALTRGAKKVGTGAPVKDLAGLPADTAALFSFTEGDAMVKEAWPSMAKSLTSMGQDPASLGDQFGLTLPDDIATLFGKQLDLVVPKQSFTKGVPSAAVRISTDAGKAEQVLAALERQGLNVPSQRCGERLCIGTTSSAVAALSGSGLSANPAFTTAVADADKARAIMYVDFDALESQYLDQVPADQRDFVAAMKTMGMSVVEDGNDSRTTVRLVAN